MHRFEPRIYREGMGRSRFRSFTSAYLETDLWIGVDPDSWTDGIPAFCNRVIRELREVLDSHISLHPEFQSSLVPLPDDEEAEVIIREMTAASSRADVGPMASVAGAFAQHLGKRIEEEFAVRELVIENGGDIYLRITEPLAISVFAGKSPLSEKIGVLVPPGAFPSGICTSSGTVGHSFSFGKADAVMIGCRDALVADAFATSFCNKVQTAEDIESVLDQTGKQPEILSAVVVIGDRMGIRGEWEMQVYG